MMKRFLLSLLCLVLVVPSSDAAFLNITRYPAVIVTGGGGGGIPSWLSGAVDYERFQLSTVSNGKESANDVGLGNSCINAFSGGSKTIDGDYLFVFCGGHNDDDNNGLYAFDIRGDSSTTGWIIVIANNSSSSNPLASHSYDGMQFSGPNNTFYLFGGGRAQWGGTAPATNETWRVVMDGSPTWEQLGNYPAAIGNNEIWSIYSKEDNRVLVGNGNAGSYAFFNLSNDTWGSSGSGAIGWQTGAYDTNRNRGFSVSNEGPSIRQYNITWSSSLTNTTKESGFGTLPLGNSSSIFYDELKDEYWAFGGGGSSDWSQICEINASTLQMGTCHNLKTHGGSNTQIPTNGNCPCAGSYGRFLWKPEWRTVFTFNDTAGPMYAIKLPD